MHLTSLLMLSVIGVLLLSSAVMVSISGLPMSRYSELKLRFAFVIVGIAIVTMLVLLVRREANWLRRRLGLKQRPTRPARPARKPASWARRAWIAAPLAILLTLTGGAYAAEARTQVLVQSVVDGDTIDVTIDGVETRIRLLNVDSPETVHPDENVECMGPEASALLRELLPPGTQIRLQYDQDLHDRYGRTLAGVFKDGVLVNAEIARQGLGIAVVFGGNDRFFDPVSEAQAEAEEHQRGLFDSERNCTIPGQISQLQAASESLEGTPADLDEKRSRLAEVAALSATAVVLLEVLDGDPTLFPMVAHAARESLKGTVEALSKSLDTREQVLVTAIQNQERRIEEERLERERQEREEQERLERERQEREEQERLERERQEREEQERLERERIEREQQERLQREQQEREQRERNRQPAAPAQPAPSRPSGSNGGSGDSYTGCRAYGGGYVPNAVDSQGRPYTKIDCSSKRPIG